MWKIMLYNITGVSCAPGLELEFWGVLELIDGGPVQTRQ